MAVKGKKVQKQQKPVPKLAKQPNPEEDEELEEDDADDEELQEQSDENVDEKEDNEDDENEEEEEDDDEDEDDESETQKKVEKSGQEEAEKDEEDESMHTTIFVGHINYHLTQKELNDFFKKAGEIESSRIIPKRGYAFVTFKEAASVEDALKLNKQMLSGKPVHVEKVKSKRSDNQKKQSLKRKHNMEQNEKGAKKAKVEGKTVNLKKSFNSKGGKRHVGKGKPKTPQKSHSNKKQNKSTAGKLTKTTA